MKYRLITGAFIAAFMTMFLSSCYYGPYHHHRPRAHYYRPNHGGYHHGY